MHLLVAEQKSGKCCANMLIVFRLFMQLTRTGAIELSSLNIVNRMSKRFMRPTSRIFDLRYAGLFVFCRSVTIALLSVLPLCTHAQGQRIAAGPQAGAAPTLYALLPGEDADRKIQENHFIKIETDKRDYYTGEVITVTYKLYSRLVDSTFVAAPRLSTTL